MDCIPCISLLYLWYWDKFYFHCVSLITVHDLCMKIWFCTHCYWTTDCFDNTASWFTLYKFSSRFAIFDWKMPIRGLLIFLLLWNIKSVMYSILFLFFYGNWLSKVRNLFMTFNTYCKRISWFTLSTVIYTLLKNTIPVV